MKCLPCRMLVHCADGHSVCVIISCYLQTCPKCAVHYAWPDGSQYKESHGLRVNVSFAAYSWDVKIQTYRMFVSDRETVSRCCMSHNQNCLRGAPGSMKALTCSPLCQVQDQRRSCSFPELQHSLAGGQGRCLCCTRLQTPWDPALWHHCSPARRMAIEHSGNKNKWP